MSKNSVEFAISLTWMQFKYLREVIYSLPAVYRNLSQHAHVWVCFQFLWLLCFVSILRQGLSIVLGQFGLLCVAQVGLRLTEIRLPVSSVLKLRCEPLLLALLLLFWLVCYLPWWFLPPSRTFNEDVLLLTSVSRTWEHKYSQAGKCFQSVSLVFNSRMVLLKWTLDCLEAPMKTVLLPNSKKLCPEATNVLSWYLSLT